MPDPRSKKIIKTNRQTIMCILKHGVCEVSALKEKIRRGRNYLISDGSITLLRKVVSRYVEDTRGYIILCRSRK